MLPERQQEQTWKTREKQVGVKIVRVEKCADTKSKKQTLDVSKEDFQKVVEVVRSTVFNQSKRLVTIQKEESKNKPKKLSIVKRATVEKKERGIKKAGTNDRT